MEAWTARLTTYALIQSQYNPSQQLRRVAAMLPQVFPPEAGPTSANTNASKQQEKQQRAGELAARASAVADEMDAAIRTEAVMPVLRITTPGALKGWLDWVWLDIIDRLSHHR